MRRVLVKEIIAASASSAGISVKEILSEDRTYRTSHPRQRAMFLARAYRPDLSLPYLGRVFRRDHSTVIHAIKAVEQRQRRGPEEGDALQTIRAALSLDEHPSEAA